MIRHRKIKEEDGTGEYSIFELPDIEFINPLEYYSTVFIAKSFAMMKDIMLNSKSVSHISNELIDRVVMKNAVKDWDKKLEETLKTQVPESFISILNAKSKKVQVKLLKGQSITPEQLLSFVLKASIDYGFTFSQYRVEYNHKGLDESKIPKVVSVENDEVRIIGETSLTDGQLKQAVEHRKVVVSKFLDRGNEWHCLLITYDSLKGKESWKNGQPHYHYISDKFGIPRGKVVKELKEGKYNLNSLPHIDLIDYRDINQ